MARSSALVVLLVATMAVAAMAAVPSMIKPAGLTGQTFGLFGSYKFGGLTFNKKVGWCSSWDPYTNACTYDPTYIWWAPPRPSATPFWVGPVNGAAPATTSALASCVTQTTRGVTAGGCQCIDPAGPVISPIGVSKPVNIGVGNVVTDCGAQAPPGGVVCNGWQCTCADPAANPTHVATAWAYCV